MALLLCAGTTTMSMMRNNLGIALVCMVKVAVNATNESSSTLSQFSTNATGGGVCARSMAETAADYTVGLVVYCVVEFLQGTIEWTATQQSMIFSMLYFGAILGSFVSGHPFVSRHGPKRVLLVCGVVHVVVSVLTPTLATSTPYYTVVVVRALMGVAFVG